jgi:hypothetical protein
MNWTERQHTRQTAVYPYRDEQGRVLYEVVRYEPKDFRQRVPLEGGGYQWRLDGVRRVPYRLPELLAADPLWEVFIVEGEKDADLLASVGCTTTTNVGGAGQWRPEYAQWLKDRSVVIVPDNDEPGKRHAEQVARTLVGIASRISILELPGLEPKGDVSDFMQGDPDARMTELVKHMLDAPDWKPTEEITPGINPGAPYDSPAEPKVEGALVPLVPASSGSEVNFGDIGPMSSGYWPDLIPLDHDERSNFPVECLPKVLRDFVCTVAISTQTAPDMAALLGLVVGGFAMSKRSEVEIYEDWREPLNLWSCVLLPPAERKSAILRIVGEPLLLHERTENERLADLIETTQRKEKVLRGRYEKMILDAARSDDGSERERLSNEARFIAEDLRELEVVHPVRYTCSDATQESIVGLMKSNGGRLAILSAEGDTFDIMSGRYGDKGKPNLGIYLKGHAGDDVRVDRIGRASESIEKPALSVGLLCQPDLLRDIARQRAMRGRGLLARFLWSMPKSIVGNRDIHPQAMSETAKGNYGNAVWNLLATQLPTNESIWTLHLDKYARTLLQVFRADIEGRLVGDLEPIQDWAGKVAGLVCRLAGILHGYSFPTDFTARPIDAASMDAAIRIGDYAIRQAVHIFGIMGADPDLDLARRIAAWLTERSDSMVSRREIFHRFKSIVGNVNDFERPLTILQEHGYLRVIEEIDKGRGRPSKRFQINPRVAETKDHKYQ